MADASQSKPVLETLMGLPIITSSLVPPNTALMFNTGRIGIDAVKFRMPPLYTGSWSPLPAVAKTEQKPAVPPALQQAPSTLLEM